MKPKFLTQKFILKTKRTDTKAGFYSFLIRLRDNSKPDDGINHLIKKVSFKAMRMVTEKSQPHNTLKPKLNKPKFFLYTQEKQSVSMAAGQEINFENLYSGLDNKSAENPVAGELKMTEPEAENTEVRENNKPAGTEQGQIIETEASQKIIVPPVPDSGLSTAEIQLTETVPAEKAAEAQADNSVKSALEEETSNNGEISENVEIIESDSLFLASVKNLSEDEIELNEAVRNKKKKQIDYVRYALLAMCAAVFFYSGYNIVLKVVQYIRADINNAEIRDIFYGNDATSNFTDQSKPLAIYPMDDLLSLQKKKNINIRAEIAQRNERVIENTQRTTVLSEKNPDFYGWIHIPGTNIDYPVVQTNNNDYYLHHNFDKESSSSGTIFVDCLNDKDVMLNYNTILYGHNMKNNTMFRRILFFSENERNFRDGTIELTINGSIYIYEVFATYKTAPEFYYIQTMFLNDQMFVDWCNEMASKSIFKKHMTFTPEDRILTLSTCTSSPPNYRVSVQAKLVQVIETNLSISKK